ncbi:MAG TPA: methyltransferase, TIGR04325 family [Desulfuromonadaceae bacterium]
MKEKITRILAGIIPPMVRALFTSLADHDPGFSGNYRTWREALAATDGYDAEVILTRVRDALLKVKNGAAVYERDSVLFDEVEYSWPLLAALLWVASRSGNRLNLIDFGGSLGSTYYQNIRFLSHLEELTWSIVEQKRFVECGRSHFENPHLKFYQDMEACLTDRHPDAILFSSVIQYLEKPYELLADVVARGFTYIIFDRTPFLEHGDDRITIQHVPAEIYPASYPAWFFNREKFFDFFSGAYDVMADFDSFESFRLEDQTTQNKGVILVRR